MDVTLNPLKLCIACKAQCATIYLHDVVMPVNIYNYIKLQNMQITSCYQFQYTVLYQFQTLHLCDT